MPVIVGPARRRLVASGPAGARAVYGHVPAAEAPVPPEIPETALLDLTGAPLLDLTGDYLLEAA